MTRSNASGSTERTKPVVAMPALAMTMSMPPKCSTTPSTALCSAFQSVTSACQERAARPMRSATRCCSSASSPTSATFAPSAASRSASPAPMPLAAPVTSTTLLRTFLVVHQVGSDVIGRLQGLPVRTDTTQLTASRLLHGRV